MFANHPRIAQQWARKEASGDYRRPDPRDHKKAVRTELQRLMSKKGPA